MRRFRHVALVLSIPEMVAQARMDARGLFGVKSTNSRTVVSGDLTDSATT
jgi:hypothetical protein